MAELNFVECKETKTTTEYPLLTQRQLTTLEVINMLMWVRYRVFGGYTELYSEDEVSLKELEEQKRDERMLDSLIKRLCCQLDHGAEFHAEITGGNGIQLEYHEDYHNLLALHESELQRERRYFCERIMSAVTAGKTVLRCGEIAFDSKDRVYVLRSRGAQDVRLNREELERISGVPFVEDEEGEWRPDCLGSGEEK